MGFGAYDEDEQDKQDFDGSDVEVVATDRSDHEGEMKVNTGESTKELIDRLQGMKDE